MLGLEIKRESTVLVLDENTMRLQCIIQQLQLQLWRQELVVLDVSQSPIFY